MRIELLHFTPIEPMAMATAQPYQGEGSEKLVERVWKSGHRSIARHGMAMFHVEGVSQSFLRQVSRHPHVNLTVKSSRYCDMSDAAVAVPPFIKEDDFDMFMNDYHVIMEIYSRWGDAKGYTKEQQRELSKLMLPLGSGTEMVVSGNYQALYEFLQLRICKRAEWEIRMLAEAIAKILSEVMPAIFADMGCKGDEFGFCPEGRESCGKHPLKAA